MMLDIVERAPHGLPAAGDELVGMVEIEQSAQNQDGELSVLGSGIVELPSRR